MRIATFNANSIRTRIPVILDWIQQHKPNVLAIQETKVPDHAFPVQIFLDQGLFVDFRGQKSYNGVAIISDHPLKNVKTSFLNDNMNHEARYIRADYMDLDIINTYVPQGRDIESTHWDYKLNFIKNLGQELRSSCSKESLSIWLGDMNVALSPIDVHNPHLKKNHVCYHQDIRSMYESVLNDLWIDLFREKNKESDQYTFWDYRVREAVQRKIGWRIDFIFGTQRVLQHLENIWIDTVPRTQPHPSDHTFLVADFNF